VEGNPQDPLPIDSDRFFEKSMTPCPDMAHAFWNPEDSLSAFPNIPQISICNAKKKQE
jgi:hypothetical protein